MLTVTCFPEAAWDGYSIPSCKWASSYHTMENAISLQVDVLLEYTTVKETNIKLISNF